MIVSIFHLFYSDSNDDVTFNICKKITETQTNCSLLQDHVRKAIEDYKKFLDTKQLVRIYLGMNTCPSVMMCMQYWVID